MSAVKLRASESRWRLFVQEQKLVLLAGCIAAALIATGRARVERLPSIIDVELLLVLFALILAVELIRESNLLTRIAGSILPRFRTARRFTLAAVLLAGGLAALVTNDVALFVIVPLTVAAGRMGGFDVRAAVMLEIVASNLLGCLTPIGNPQNLFLYYRTGWSVGRFVATMIPFVAWSGIGIAIAIAVLEPARRLAPPGLEVQPLRRSQMLAGLAVFALVVLGVGGLLPPWPAAAVAAVASLVLIRERIGEVDLFILPLFFFAFIIVEGLRSFDVYRLFEALPREPDGLSLYATSLLSSQVISNVPAAVLLAPLAGVRWKLLLYGVNAGGCGTLIASMANLIGWRLYLREAGPDPKFLRLFAVLQLALLLWTGIGGWFLARP